MRVFGTDLADLFEAAAASLFDAIVVNREEIRPGAPEMVSLAAETIADLYLTWLNELIFRSETGHRLYSEFHVQVDESQCAPRLQAAIAGEPIDRDRHILDHEVRAAPRHGLTVQPFEGGWQAEVILDI